MNKYFKILFGIIICIIFIIVIYYFITPKENNLYYTYEGSGKLVMSATANKVNNYKKLNNDYFIKENVTKKQSSKEVIEVLYSSSLNESYYVYGYYSKNEFNNYFKKQIEEGLICNNTIYYTGEGTSMKCIIHKNGYEYEKIASELCVTINNRLICIKPNDWEHIEKYKKEFERAGWICEYKNYSEDEWDKNKIPKDGNLECSKKRPSENNYQNNELYCFIGTDGGAICNNNIGWCGINSDLMTWCTGVN